MVIPDRRGVLAGMAIAPATVLASQSHAGSATFRSRLTAVLGAMPPRPKPSFAVLEKTPIEGGTRYKIEYLAERGDPRLATPDDQIRAYLLVPDLAPGARLPAIVAIHQDGPQSHIGKAEPAGLAGDPSLFYGLDLFRRGYVVICADRFEHAERRRVVPNDMSSIDPDRDDMLASHWCGQLLLTGRTAFGKEIYDQMVTTDILASLPYVDPARIGTLGHSAGGMTATLFAFADPRIKATVSSCGLFSFAEFYSETAKKRRLGIFALPGLLNVGDSGDYLAEIAPRSIMLTRGLYEWGQDADGSPFSHRHVEDTRRMQAVAAKTFAARGAPDALTVVYFDEEGGNHAFPPHVKAKAYAWLDDHLKKNWQPA